MVMVSVIEITPIVPLVMAWRFASLMGGIIRHNMIVRKGASVNRVVIGTW